MPEIGVGVEFFFLGGGEHFVLGLKLIFGGVVPQKIRLPLLLLIC